MQPPQRQALGGGVPGTDLHCTAQTASKSDMPPSTHSLVLGRLRLPCSMHLDFFPRPFGPVHFFVGGWSSVQRLVAARQNVFLSASTLCRRRLIIILACLGGCAKHTPHRAILLSCFRHSTSWVGRHCCIRQRPSQGRVSSSTSLVSSAMGGCSRRAVTPTPITAI
jgi:hypothetical protein